MAKEQGLRSRAAFKLTQINRKYSILNKVENGVLDLCAAPGGWTQVVARTLNDNSVPIVAVDILPIRGFAHQHPNVTTLIGDITTDKTKAEIKQKLRGQKVDVVLHDGAPNVGADYTKDAYEQNEIALHALRCATHHLQTGGTFVTKIYRSTDYAKFMWCCQQFFESVHVFKPKASRAQSAEIFWIATKYTSPAKIDPRLLDPKYVFASVQGETTGGVLGNNNALSIFHKNRDKARRQRGGYDETHYDATMRHIESIHTFVTTKSLATAIQMLSVSTGLSFHCQQCSDASKSSLENEPKCFCRFLSHHPLTTNEIKTCLTDLQVLNKTDFKGLLNWRDQMQEAIKESGTAKDGAAEDSNEDDEDRGEDDSDQSDDSDKEEEEIEKEIQLMREKKLREKKRVKKKERAQAAKRRQRAALGMDLNAIDVPDNDQLFSLATITSKRDLAAASEVNLDKVTDEEVFGNQDDEIVVPELDEEEAEDRNNDDEQARQRKREEELDRAYQTYLESTKDQAAKTGTRMQKRSKKLERERLASEVIEDEELALSKSNYDAKAYAKLLQGQNDSDSDSDSDHGETSSRESDDGFDAEPLTPEEHAAIHKRRLENAPKNPLLPTFDEETASSKTARWFSNPLFATLGKEIEKQKNKTSSSAQAPVEEAAEAENAKKRKNAGIDADELLAMMPKTDKQIRHEKRLKAMARDERRKAKKAKRLGEGDVGIQIAPMDDAEDGDNLLEGLSEEKKKKVLESRELIKAGMGAFAEDKSSGFEIVASESPLPRSDDRRYDSDHEDYDSDDMAETLALGTMILRRSKEKALVDSSYNRYAWNDPKDLPDWFVDDEKRNYRPQLPIPQALVEKMKAKMMALSAKPIKRVAEARARKHKRARAKLEAAKKQAAVVANSTEMTESMKLKAISKALRGQESKRPSKTYVVAKKGRGNAGVKGVKFVDKRMKSDKRAQKRIAKRKGKK